MLRKVEALHGTVIASRPDDPFGYYGWPTIARTEEGTLWVAASGMRNAHICPWGKSVIFRGTDNGSRWSEPIVVNNSMIDDRDCGLLALPGNRLLLSWFTSDTSQRESVIRRVQHRLDYRPLLRNWDADTIRRELGSFIRIMDADGAETGSIWTEKRSVPVSSPHGPILLHDGKLLYFGRMAEGACHDLKEEKGKDGLGLFSSEDEGVSWTEIFHVDQPDGSLFYCEPHVLELSDGRLLAMIRQKGGVDGFSMAQIESSDHGKSWTDPRFIAKGSPPHLLRHSSGTLICTYGWRDFPGYGQRAIFSRDEGRSWSEPWILRDDGPNEDLGYPSTVELPDGSLFTVYYQHPDGANLNAALMWTRWALPKAP